MSDPKTSPKTDVKTEDQWDEEVLTEALGDALKPDGSVDFEKLRATGLTTTLDERTVERR